MQCRIRDLRCKEVINICDGTRLGFVSDVELDLDCGTVIALLVPGCQKLFDFKFGKCDFVRVLWCDIERIGDDVILVRAHRPAGRLKEK